MGRNSKALTRRTRRNTLQKTKHKLRTTFDFRLSTCPWSRHSLNHPPLDCHVAIPSGMAIDSIARFLFGREVRAMSPEPPPQYRHVGSSAMLTMLSLPHASHWKYFFTASIV